MDNPSKNTQITTAYINEFNEDIEANIRLELEKIVGLPVADIDAIMVDIGNEMPLLAIDSIYITPELDEVEQQIEDTTTQQEFETQQEIKQVAKDNLLADYNPQNAKEGFTIPEVKITSAVKTTNIADINYAPFKKQSFLRVFIDNAKNMILSNSKNKQLDLLHSSGNYIKIDSLGNVTEYIKGNYKKVILGDYALEVRGSRGASISVDDFLKVGGKKNTLVNSIHTQTDGSLTINSNTTITKNLTVNGATTTQTVDSTEITADKVTAPILIGTATKARVLV